MKNLGAEFFIPDNLPIEEAIARTTHMGISAHQDDLEIMAYHGVMECFGRKDKWFFAAVVTDGAGSPRAGLYESYTDEEMKAVRKREQKKAAYVGEYGGLALMNYPSKAVKNPDDKDVIAELAELIGKAKPKVIYTHNLADKHDTHVGVAVKVIKAIRTLPEENRPEKVYACEVWRGLDWINDNEKVLFDVTGHPNISAAILEVHDSQICGGKRYDLATAGRRLANATYAESHGTDETSALTYAMDLTPLIKNDSLDIKEYVLGYIDRFKEDVSKKINKVL
ncbi:MAG TPA: PIG-L family deacetylase [Clostridiaceae bacterium]|jgi:LmbE family N-acetylglucosaminyl deacetylase|nr:PIG-L family deacetylase [Clostridiaceae bacterium]